MKTPATEFNVGRGRRTPPRRAAESPSRRGRATPPYTGTRGSVLIIVIWVCLGLVALTVYFASSMSSELRAADNRAAEIAARAAVEGGTRYAQFVLSQFGTNGKVPNREDYKYEDLPVGEAAFWFIGRDPDQPNSTEPYFGLIDEASKINVNTAPRSMLEAIPGMTPELADAIMTWRNRRSDGGGNDNVYARLDPPRLNKSGQFETVDEVRLVYGATLEILFGEDTNRNGVLDENEDDNEQSAPRDNGDGLLQPGVLEYLTVYTREPNTRQRGGRRTNVATNQARQQQQFRQRFGQLLGNQGRAQAILAAIGTNELSSVLEFMVRGRMTADEFNRVRDEITTSNNNTLDGLINVNTASETVLACIPGIGQEYASAIIAYRAAHPDTLVPFTWLTQVVPSSNLIRAGRYLTDRSYQFSVDVAAIGNMAGRGYCRQKTVFDMRRGTPRIVFHQDLTAYGWALGTQVRELLREGRSDRT